MALWLPANAGDHRLSECHVSDSKKQLNWMWPLGGGLRGKGPLQPAEQAKTVAELEKARTGSKLHVENRFGPSGCFTRAQAAFGIPE